MLFYRHWIGADVEVRWIAAADGERPRKDFLHFPSGVFIVEVSHDIAPVSSTRFRKIEQLVKSARLGQILDWYCVDHCLGYVAYINVASAVVHVDEKLRLKLWFVVLQVLVFAKNIICFCI